MTDERSKNNLSKLSIYTKLFVVNSMCLIKREQKKTGSVCLQLPLSEHLFVDLVTADNEKLFLVIHYVLYHAQNLSISSFS